jgi:anti-sigma factor RsiW
MKRFLGDLQGAHAGLERLSAYLDNQVSGAERAQLEAHLHQCALCQGDLESLRQTVTWLHMLPRVPVPRAFTLSEVQAGIRRPVTRA